MLRRIELGLAVALIILFAGAPSAIAQTPADSGICNDPTITNG